MSSRRDKDYHFLRNSEKYLGEWYRGCHVFQYGEQSTEVAEKEKAFDKVWGKYGFKSMVGNKRRRNTTRKSNQKYKQMIHQIERAKNKEETRKELKKFLDVG